MKLKNQFIIFIMATILMPFFCVMIILGFHYITDPERTLLQDFNYVRKIESNKLSPKSWDTLQEILKKAPPHTETAVLLQNGDILISNISDLKRGDTVSEEVLFQNIKKSSKKYFFQFVPTMLDDKNTELVIISKAPRRKAPMHKSLARVILHILGYLVIFSIVPICFIIKIAWTISKSISLLEKNTVRIANGELDIELKNALNKKNSNEITSLIESLDKMRQTIKEDQERRTRFIMGISHDLRTPVAVIKGYTEALADGIADDMEMRKSSLEIISSKVAQLETMIETLINYVKLNSKDWRGKLTKQSLASALKEFEQSAIAEGKVFKRNISTKIEVSEDVLIAFNRQLFLRTLENIYGNAIRYSRDGDSIKIEAIQTDENVEISIIDTGIGISDEDKNHIFDLFYRASNSRREEGMGIGLSVVKNIVDAHGWKITVQDNRESSSGSVFTITIPLENS